MEIKNNNHGLKKIKKSDSEVSKSDLNYNKVGLICVQMSLHNSMVKRLSTFTKGMIIAN
ncbi:hypothetical protein [Tepidibacillus sp. HK-1]|uniref:hypothetical protein n=1 Tax=Tepidibacillus sp. HK-1 TaxID=1883407 RepID=UPI0015EC85C8|nr:hypothetical protein [Tepidibacillus sp. HK-1]